MTKTVRDLNKKYQKEMFRKYTPKKSFWNIYTVLLMTIILLGFFKMLLDAWAR